jgi:DNA-binding PadR family transcriptional regulator
VHDLTGGTVQWTTSTLYPLLHKLEGQGLLDSFWRDVGPGPDRKYYSLSRKGRKALEEEKQQWLSIHEALVTLWEPRPALNPV